MATTVRVTANGGTSGTTGAGESRPPKGRIGQFLDVLSLLPNGGPSICNFAITNVCNANCDFCGYARDKIPTAIHKWVDTDRVLNGIDILYGRGIRYLTFTGGEPTLHPGLAAMVRKAVGRGMRVSVVSNGFTLRQDRIQALAEAGVGTLFISIDAPDAAAHETNRGLKGVSARIREANALLKEHGIKTVASVTINKLIQDFEALTRFLSELGFSTVTFSYPKRALHSSSQVFSDTSALVDYSVAELVAAFQAIQAIKPTFGVLNPAASLAEMIRHLRREKEDFPCFGGFKYFYVDYNFDVYRCDFWAERMCTLESFGTVPFIRDDCTACMSDCYRDASVFLHFPVALGDALRHLQGGRIGAAVRVLTRPSVGKSIGSLLTEFRTLKRLARTG